MNKTSAELLHYTIEGSGPTLVLIHGFLESNSMWEPLQLENNFTCIKVEIPGHGKSRMSHFEESMEFIANCLQLTLKKLNVDMFDIIGHSMGGYVALEYVETYGLSGKLILLHSNFWEDDAQKKNDRLRVSEIVKTNKNLFLQEALPALFLEPKKHFTLINAMLSEAKKMKATNISKCALAMRNRKDHKKTLISFGSRIFIIQGEKDKLVTLEKMKAELSELPNKIVIIPNVGHMGQHENPKLIRNEIKNFLA